MISGIPTWWPSRGLLVGIALSAPFIANPFPTWLAILFVLPAIVDLYVRGVRIKAALRIAPILFFVYALAFIHIIAIHTTPYKIYVIYNLIWSGGAVGLFLLAVDERDQPNDIVQGFLASLAITATIVATAGLVKYMLQLQGYLFEFMIGSCFGRYPQGTTFCGDYNLFGLYLIIGAFGLSVFILSGRHSRLSIIVLLLALTVVITAGFFAGSRRFTFVALLVPTLWITIALYRRDAMYILRLAILPILGTALLYSVFNYPYTPVPDNKSVIIERAIVGWWNSLDKEAMANSTTAPSYHLSARSVSPSALAASMGPSEAFGFNSRLDRWKLALQMVEENGYVLGRGFSYHQQFSCTFVQCEHIDYPHSPILSAWVAFGIVGLILALGFYATTVLNIILAGKDGLLSGASFIAMAVMPYSLISGDTIFSLPHTLIGALLVSVAARKSTTLFGFPLPWSRLSHPA